MQAVGAALDDEEEEGEEQDDDWGGGRMWGARGGFLSRFERKYGGTQGVMLAGEEVEAGKGRRRRVEGEFVIMLGVLGLAGCE